MPIRIAYHAPQSDDATSWYRCLGPLSDLASQGHVTYRSLADIGWHTLIDIDVVFLQRPYRDIDVDIMKACKALNVKVWVDFDDNHLHVDNLNPRADIYGAKHAGLWSYFTEQSDILTLSTQPLKDSIGRMDAHVVRNTMPLRWWQAWSPRPDVCSDIVYWRGGKSHFQDWLVYREPLTRVNMQDYELHMMGEISGRVRKSFPAMHMESPKSLLSYYTHVRSLAPRVTIVPLKDTVFNRSKSDIAWLEAVLLCGGIAVTPMLPEWLDRPGTVPYEGPGDFADAVERAMQLEYKQANIDAMKWLNQHRHPQQRLDQLKEILDEAIT